MNSIASEIERFDRLSATWWNERGPMRALHVVNALRILDVGCGGGLLAEPLARLGAHVVGAPGNISAARLHVASESVSVSHCCPAKKFGT